MAKKEKKEFEAIRVWKGTGKRFKVKASKADKSIALFMEELSKQK